MHAVLAARSHFSIGESTLTPGALVDAAVKAGAKAVALTDTMAVTGMIDFTTKAVKAGVKPIVGCRLRVLDQADLAWRKTKDDKKAPREYGLIVYVLREDGLQTLFRLLSLANSDERYYFVPRLGFADVIDALAAAPTDSLAIASGDVSGLAAHADAPDLLARLSAAVGASNAFLTLTPINTPYWDAMNARAIRLRETLSLPFLVTVPSFYAPAGDQAHEVLTAVVANRKLDAPWHPSDFVRDHHPKDLRTLYEACKAAAGRLSEQRGIAGADRLFAEGMRNTARLADAVSFEWKKMPVSLPTMAPDEFAALVAECKKGWLQRFKGPVFGHKPSDEELKGVYQQRLIYELQVLKTLGFSGYFLLVQDVVQFAKGAGILVGPGRGSVGGSLVAYLMGITDCDPLRFGLLFERFINPERLDLPDADLDFMSERRGEVIDYLINKYGAQRVAGISNFGTLGPASSIRGVGKAFGLPEAEFECSKFAPKLHGANVPLKDAIRITPEFEKFATRFPDVWKMCLGVEGTMNVLGRHAAGVVVGGCDLVERAVVERRKDGATVCWDKRIVEDMGLVKMDILGLNTLDLIALTLTYIRERHGKRIDLMRIPLDDAGVLEAFRLGLTTGVFQFEGGGMKRLLKNIGKDGVITFDDVTAATALYRPGPMESGMMDSFWRRKAGEEAIDYDHPLMEPILKETYGVIVYQEQVMKISQAIAGYTGAGADKLRKIMGKKLPEEMKKERGKFVEGCVATIACDEEWAGALFDKIEGFAGYGFNKSHSVEYSLISYQSMWLKMHYMVEFFAAALSLMDQKKLPGLLKDADKLGIEILVPDVDLSTDRFEILTDTKLAIPFSRVKGISTTAAQAIIRARKEVGGRFSSTKHLVDTLVKLGLKAKCNARAIASLDKVGAFARIEPGQLPAKHPDRVRDQQELIPGLIQDVVPIGREMFRDKVSLKALLELVQEYREAHGPKGAEEDEFGGVADGMPVKPAASSKQRLMVIFDAPSNAEEKKGKIGMGDGFGWERTVEAIHETELLVKDCYLTALIKRPKEGKQVSSSEIALYGPYLEREIEILRPPVIVLLGGATVRHFLPGFKGKASEEAGKVVYDKARDANLIIGFNPGECYYDPEKQLLLNEIFETAAQLVS